MSVYVVTLFFCSVHSWIVTLNNTSSYMSMSTSLLNFFNFTYVFCWCVSVDWYCRFVFVKCCFWLVGFGGGPAMGPVVRGLFPYVPPDRYILICE